MNPSKCLGLWRRCLFSMILGGIDLYLVKFISQYDVCCCVVWASFRFECFVKIWATCENVFGQMVYRPPPPPPGKKLPVHLCTCHMLSPLALNVWKKMLCSFSTLIDGKLHVFVARLPYREYVGCACLAFG